MRTALTARARRRQPDHRGTVVAITGGARGIGRATARAFRDAGATVVIGDIDADLVARTAAELGVLGLPLDVTDRVGFEGFFEAIEATTGPVDVLVNNAGIMPTGTFLDEDPAMAQRMVDVNVYGILNGSRAAASRFAARGRGSIINVASLAGELSLPGLATYCGTKRFVIGFSEVLRQELRPSGVSVTTVLPGIVRTELSAGTRVPRWLEAITTVDPEQIAAGVIAAGGRSRIVVPGALGRLITAQGVLPAEMRFALVRRLGLDSSATDTDPTVRAAYHERITQASL